MGKGALLYLFYSTIALLLSSLSTVDACLWCVQIDESPAPPVQDVPPFSQHALRDRSYLPYQIIGVLAAYVGSVLITGTLLLTVGRKMRKRAQTARPQEMSKPIHKAFDPSPISPSGNRGWYKLRNKKSGKDSLLSSVNEMSPVASIGSFDNHVLEADRARMQEDMERLYAAVMDQEDRRNYGVQENTTAEPPDAPEISVARPPSDPPAYAGSDLSLRQWEQSRQTTAPPPLRSPVRAIYPAEVLEVPFTPTTPIDPERQQWPQSPAASSGTYVNSPQSLRSVRSASSGKLRKNLRNLTISSPIQRPIEDNDDGARTPLSPFTYANPGAPPEPPTTAHSIAAPLETPATERMMAMYTGQDEAEEEGEGEGEDEIRMSEQNERRSNESQYKPLPASPRPQPPQTPSFRQAVSSPGPITTNFSKPVSVIPSAPAPALTHRATGTGMLPLREMNRQYVSQQQQQQQQQQQAQQPLSFRPDNPNSTHLPLSPTTHRKPSNLNPNNARITPKPLTHPTPYNPLSPTSTCYLTSAGPVKTTFVETRSRRDQLGLTPGIRTGMAATPYSPYMPFTPITPVTPHLTSRAQRKQIQREMKKATGGVILEEDAVAGEEELWGGAY